MDDVWNAKAWKVLSASLPKDDITGSRILLTTRSEGVAYGVADLQPLGEEESWILLQKKISQQESCPPKLKELGMQISKKTKGIPFAIILVAGILFNAEKTVERWTEVLESLEQTKIGGNDQYLTSIIGMSYQDLPDCLRHCFLYFGALPQDDEILTSKLIGLWITKGFVKNSKDFLES
ncbi:putative late blight resistance protein R1B-16 [Capsicum annuum]|uniref:putative late blight resistance protein homolog R1B-16 n=1 Tax=Capsicum annuum TaxID=4072 RepID=UPI001FB1007E|nr:putative late blight resistance protein homolog R1B-16 [Capsicum annuum]